MSRQSIKIKRTEKQNQILELEKKYFQILEDIVSSAEFKTDLESIEKAIKENYKKYENIWNIKNKLNIPAERLVTYYVHKKFQGAIKGIYPTPISSDLGVRLKDCMLIIDVKTIDTNGNSNDIKSTSVESNQTSFDNSNYHYINTVSSIDPIDDYSGLPVITYIIKIIYTDDGYSFGLSRTKHPSIILVCIPNGKLSDLFDKNIIENFKTYNYYHGKDKPCFEPIIIPDTVQKKDIKAYVENICVNKKGFTQTILKTNNTKKIAYIDSVNRALWWFTSENNKPVIIAVKSGSTARYYNDYLENRYDSNNNPWIGYKEFKI